MSERTSVTTPSRAGRPDGADRADDVRSSDLDTAAALSRVLNELTPAQLRDLVEGRGRLVYTPCSVAPSRRPVPVPLDVTADVAAIHLMSAPAEVSTHLADRRFTVPVLRELARAMGPTVPSTGRNRAELVHGIVEGTVGFRARSAALSGGAWI